MLHCCTTYSNFSHLAPIHINDSLIHMFHFQWLSSETVEKLTLYTYRQQHTADHVHIYLVTDKENDIRDKEITQKVWPQSVVSLSLSLPVHQTSNCIEHAAPNIKYRHHMENKAQSGTNTLINTGIQKILYILVHFIACYITGIHYL